MRMDCLDAYKHVQWAINRASGSGSLASLGCRYPQQQLLQLITQQRAPLAALHSVHCIEILQGGVRRDPSLKELCVIPDLSPGHVHNPGPGYFGSSRGSSSLHCVMCTLYGRIRYQTCLDTNKREEENFCQNMFRRVLTCHVPDIVYLREKGYSALSYSLECKSLSPNEHLYPITHFLPL